ncbi:cysteine hydrolase family protein [Paucidesulfovibrio longus]|uniref:cysteine hydrolase family protein n=1 Tax=Paucidesulfovibrio longus TaxID=889 RepID=UPI0003B746C9|nr:cysteine hydrolase family protein [Paucidesulfovibrio longus]
MFALLVIDMQAGLFSPQTPRFDARGVVRRINELIRAARKSATPVVFVRHAGRPGESLEPGTPGWEILPDLDRADSDPVVDKAACDAFCRTNLHAVLQGLGASRLVLAGCCTDFCVDTTLRAAASLGYEVFAASDAHTTADRPHLDAEEVIRHHNWVWEELITPESAIRVLPTAKLLPLLEVR